MSELPWTPLNFGGLPPEHSDAGQSKVMVLPVPYEGTTSFKSGTREGPLAILLASRQLELYDEELDAEPYLVGIATAPELQPSRRDYQVPILQTYEAVRATLAQRQFPLVLGGEHSITAGSVKAAHEVYHDLCVLQIDAHADLRDDYEDSPHSHASVMRRISDQGIPITQVGIRNISRAEMDFWREKRPTTIFWAKDLRAGSWDPAQVACTLGEHVYITIDVDGLDPAIMPATGTPEPGGLGWYELLAVLRKVFETRTVVGADIVELAPIGGTVAPDFLCAKLAYKLIGYRYFIDSRPGP